MIHENTFYFSDDPEATEPPRRLFGFSGCVVTLKGLELEVSAVAYPLHGGVYMRGAHGSVSALSLTWWRLDTVVGIRPKYRLS